MRSRNGSKRSSPDAVPAAIPVPHGALRAERHAVHHLPDRGGESVRARHQPGAWAMDDQKALRVSNRPGDPAGRADDAPPQSRDADHGRAAHPDRCARADAAVGGPDQRLRVDRDGDDDGVWGRRVCRRLHEDRASIALRAAAALQDGLPDSDRDGGRRRPARAGAARALQHAAHLPVLQAPHSGAWLVVFAVHRLRARCSARHGGHSHQAGTAARHRRRRVRARSAVGHHPGGLVQIDRAARVQDGAHPSPLRAPRLERVQSDLALRDCRDYFRVAQPDNAEASLMRVRVLGFEVKGKRVTVAGAARSGIAAAELLARRGAHVTLSETRDEAAAAEPLRSLGVRLELGGHKTETFTGADLVVLSPGVPPEQTAVRAARGRGVPVVGELELASRWLQGRVIAITGTKGKSTTTALTGRMLEAAGFKVAVGGNIGAPLSAQVSASTPETLHVVETSSFQLEQIESFHPWIAVMLNFSADHLDRHPSLEAYAAAKARIFENQDAGDWAVVNADDPAVLALARRGRAAMRLFARREPIAEGTVIEERWIVDRREETTERLVPLDAIHLLGPHLVIDVMAAATVGAIAGATPAAMTAAVEAFPGLEHAMELVAEIGGVRFVNDSKATNVEAALRSIESFDTGLVPIMGGRFKGGDLRLLRGPLAARANAVVAIGEARPLFREALAGAVGVHGAASLQEAVQRAFELAKPSGVVLLAPACASFDMFRDYAERGRRFKEEVARLSDEQSSVG